MSGDRARVFDTIKKRRIALKWPFGPNESKENISCILKRLTKRSKSTSRQYSIVLASYETFSGKNIAGKLICGMDTFRKIIMKFRCLSR